MVGAENGVALLQQELGEVTIRPVMPVTTARRPCVDTCTVLTLVTTTNGRSANEAGG